MNARLLNHLQVTKEQH
jgi:hypothetical protein